MRTAVALIAASFLSALTSCTGSEGGSSPAAGSEAAASTPASAPPTAASASVGGVRDPGCAHSLDLTFPEPVAPPYAGPAPHLAVGDVTSLPRDWVAYDKSKTRWDWDVSRAQLLVCQTGVRQRGDVVLRECTDTSPGVELYPATYTFTVHELKTGRQVATVEIDSDAVDPQGAAVGCPATFTYQVGQGAPAFFQVVAEETMTDRLRPLIMATV